MALKKLPFTPGVNRESTNYTTEGKYWDCDKIRFRSGYPEKLGGWVQAITAQLSGVVRSFYNWQTLGGIDYLAIGTSKKLYVETGQVASNITPIRRTVSLTNPLTTTSGSNVVKVTDNAHGAATGDTVIFSGFAGTVNGIPNTELNTSLVITSVIDINNYNITTVSNASSSGNPATPGITAQYEISVGLDYTTGGTGYGIGVYGRGGYGSATVLSTIPDIRLWSMTNFGEDLIACTNNGNIYFWDSSLGTSQRAVPLQSLPGASNVPTSAILVAETDDRHTMAYGVNPLGSSVQDKMLIRWSDTEDYTNWTPIDGTNTAGDYRLTVGSTIIARERTKQEILVWTDAALYSQKFMGPPYTFSHELIASNISILSQNSAVTVNNTTYWMGSNKFYMYNGQVQTLPCDVRSYVFDDFNLIQKQQVFAGSNEQFNEVWWFYCSSGITFPNRYVIYNYIEKTWVFGNISRSAWLDLKVRGYPVAAGSSYVVYHESGLDDGELGSVQPINAFIESANFDLDDGNSSIFVKRIIPDVTFDSSTAATPAVTITINCRDYPGQNYQTTGGMAVSRSTTVPFEQYTNEQWVKLRGRQMSLKMSSNTTGVHWQLGAVRLDLQPDGRK